GFFRFVLNINPLNFISNGIIQVVSENKKLKIGYQIFFKEWIIFSILISFLFLPVFMGSIQEEPILLLLFPIIWFCIYYLPYLLSIILFTRIIKNSLNEAIFKTT
ncbi:MAG: hypothetical protein KAR38_03615, partial [Calditrichia bacterium]|nr:hypothetical protein [Calditrichia bacterium]